MQLTNDEEEVMAFPGFRVGWKCIHGIAPLVADKEDVKQRETDGAADERSREQHREIEVFDSVENERLVPQDEL